MVDLTDNTYGGHFPWKEHLFQVERELGIEGSIKFVLFTDERGLWRVQAVPVAPNSFVSRVGLLPEWRGLRDESLSSSAQLPDCTFVHASGFIGGARSRQSVLQMAVKSLSATQA